MDKPYLTVDDIATLLNVSVDTVRNYIQRKNDPLPAYKLGREYRIHPDEFQEGLKRRRNVQNGKSIGQENVSSQ